jgi:hypothetical protein
VTSKPQCTLEINMEIVVGEAIIVEPTYVDIRIMEHTLETYMKEAYPHKPIFMVKCCLSYQLVQQYTFQAYKYRVWLG